MNEEREAIIERLAYALVKAVELRTDLRALDEKLVFGSGPQEGVDSALASAMNMQINLISALTLV